MGGLRLRTWCFEPGRGAACAHLCVLAASWTLLPAAAGKASEYIAAPSPDPISKTPAGQISPGGSGLCGLDWG
jgi:hypothetical protein